MYKRFIILPVILLLCAVFLGWHTMPVASQTTTTGTEVANLEATFQNINNLPAGSPFSVTLTADQLTKAAEEILVQYNAEIKAALKQYVNIDVSISNPKVEFSAEGFRLSAKAGVGFLKLTAKLHGTVNLVDGKPVITVQKIDAPVVRITPEDANAEISALADRYMNDLLAFCTLTKIEMTDGQVLVEGVRN